MLKNIRNVLRTYARVLVTRSMILSLIIVIVSSGASVEALESNLPPVDITISNNQVLTGAVAGSVIGSLSSRDSNLTDSHSYVFYPGEYGDHNSQFSIVGSELRTNQALNFNTLSKADVFVTGGEARNYEFDTPGFVGTPDGPVTYVKDGSTYIVFTSNGQDRAVYRTTTTDFINFTEPTKVFSKSDIASRYDSSYTGPGTVIKLKNGDYEMYFHAERHACGENKPVTFSIGKAISKNKGLTWTRQSSPIVTGQDTAGSCTSMQQSNRIGQGAGYPSLVKQGSYYYLFFTDWKGSGAFEWAQTHVARASVNTTTGGPGTFKKFYNGSYSSSVLAGKSTAVIKESGEPYYYALGASVSFNVSLNKFVAVYTTDMGFFTRTSAVSSKGLNGVNWEAHETIMDFPDPYATVKPHSTWYSYPTLLSVDRATSMETSLSGNLIYAGTHDFPDSQDGSGVWHETYQRQFRYKQKGRKSVRLYSTDNMGGYFQEAFSIYAVPANAAPTKIQIKANSPYYPNPQTWSPVTENSAVGSFVGTLVGTDPENDSLMLSECHNNMDNRYFRILDNRMYTDAVLDFENPLNENPQYPNNYSVCVQAKDASGNTFQWHIFMIIEDVIGS